MDDATFRYDRTAALGGVCLVIGISHVVLKSVGVGPLALIFLKSPASILISVLAFWGNVRQECFDAC